MFQVNLISTVLNYFLGLQEKDAKAAAIVQRKIVMKGCSKPWVLAVRQIVMNLETSQVEDSDLKHEEAPVIPETAEENFESSSTKTEWI